MPGRRLQRRTYVGYALGSVGTGGFATVPGLLLLIYLTDTLGVAAWWAGFVVFVPKAWDVLLNPWVGNRSDRTTSRWGPRIPWMIAGTVLLPLAFAAMFAGPFGWTGAPAAAWVMGWFLVASTGFAFFQVPYIAQPAELTDDYAERTTLMTWRVAALTLAILAFGAGAPALVNATGGVSGHRFMGVIAGLVLLVGFAGAVLGTFRQPIVLQAEPAEPGLRAQLDAVRSNREFRVLFVAFILQALATSAMLASAPYVARYLLGDDGLTTVLFVALVAPAILLVPAWRWLSNTMGKQRSFLIATVVFIVGTVALLGVRELPRWGVYAAVGVCGVAYAGLQLLPLAMLPDTIQADSARSGRRRSGTFTGVWTAGETAGFALGPALVAATLAIGGFVSSSGDVQVTQPNGALIAIVLGFALVPGVLAVASVPLVRKYDLTQARLEDLVTQADASAPRPEN